MTRAATEPPLAPTLPLPMSITMDNAHRTTQARA